MTTFYDFSQALTSSGQREDSLGLSQKNLDARFSSVVSTSPFRLWSPGNPIPAKGKRLLIGVATWSAYDMKLLDAVSQALPRPPVDLTVEVFNVADCSSPEAFDRYVPDIGRVFQTPIVGLWSDGQLVDKATGRAGRELVARVSGLDSLELDRLLATGNPPH
ncbi:MAG: hypothetical protein HYS12_14355 [Planctomycetes bacterium]|nr:hypothetical protein [Planctomycetota bacterium]